MNDELEAESQAYMEFTCNVYDKKKLRDQHHCDWYCLYYISMFQHGLMMLTLMAHFKNINYFREMVPSVIRGKNLTYTRHKLISLNIKEVKNLKIRMMNRCWSMVWGSICIVVMFQVMFFQNHHHMTIYLFITCSHLVYFYFLYFTHTFS